MKRCAFYILSAAVDLYCNASVNDKFYPKFERLIKNIDELSPVAVICNLQLPYRGRYKRSVHLDLFAFRIVDASSFRAGNRFNGFITPLSNRDVLRRRGYLAANRYVAVFLSEFTSESPDRFVIHTKVRAPVCFEFLALIRRHVLPYPVRNVPRSYSGIECVKVKVGRICWVLVGRFLESVHLPFEFFQKVTRGLKSVGRWPACSFHQFFGSVRNMVRGFCVNLPVSAIGSLERDT